MQNEFTKRCKIGLWREKEGQGIGSTFMGIKTHLRVSMDKKYL